MNDRISRYYDENTSRFLRLGGSGETAAIHRQVWGPGVQNRAHSFTYTNELIKEHFTRLLPASLSGIRLLDLGCGIGGTATWLVQEMGAEVVGVSNSIVQVRLAERRAEKIGVSDQCRFYHGDFHLLDAIKMQHAASPVETPSLHSDFAGAYAVESFAHSTDPARFFQSAAGELVPAGILVLVDDFLCEADLPVESGCWLKRVQEHWHLNSLLTPRAVIDIAGKAGFALLEERNLTAYLRLLDGFRLAIMKWLSVLPLRTAYVQNLSGGAALQVCLRNGWTMYNILAFRLGMPDLVGY